MRFSIITPSFRSSRWLKLCIASVADQEVDFEHIIQDSCSDDGTQDWLLKDPRVKAYIQKDAGMYDAVNRGLRRATGDVLAYLNCDEQYLPGALAQVRDYFLHHSDVDIAFGDVVVVDAEGKYLCHRQASIPLKYHTLVSSNLAVLTCGTFFRRSILDGHGLFFNPNLKDVGDAEWVLRLIEHRVPMGVLRRFTSAFTETGVNMNLLPNAQREKKEMFESAPAWARRCRSLFILHYRLRRLFAGHYSQKPFSYSLYTEDSLNARVTKQVLKPTFRWVR
jgi:glycosyltransferase involved in cell wall biosynthesis